MITIEIGETLKGICLAISERYEINFVEVGYETDHVHFLVQSVPTVSVSESCNLLFLKCFCTTKTH